MRRRSGGVLDRAFDRGPRNGCARGGVRTLDEMVATCRDPNGPVSIKDALLLGLCDQANAEDDDAKLVLTWLMLPGLLRLRSTLPRQVPGVEGDQIDADLLLGFWTGVASIGPGAPRVAARLLNAARHEACDSLRKYISWAQRAELGEEPPERTLASEDPTFDSVIDANMPSIDEVLDRALREGVLTTFQVDLVRADRHDVRAVGARLGLTPNQTSCRRNRAAARLARWFAEQTDGHASTPRAKE